VISEVGKSRPRAGAHGLSRKSVDPCARDREYVYVVCGGRTQMVGMFIRLDTMHAW